jgi:hypothetical protein
VSESDRWEAAKEAFVIEDHASYDGLDELIDAGDALRAEVARLEGELRAAWAILRQTVDVCEYADVSCPGAEPDASLVASRAAEWLLRNRIAPAPAEGAGETGDV